MNPFIAFTILMALSLFLNNQTAQTSLDKHAVGDTKRTLASDLDAELPRLPFSDWFEKVIGPDAGVVWQLSECGEKVEAMADGAGDAQACVEANTILADGRRVIVMIGVGTFKKGVTGPPAFRFGVIEQNGELRRIPRLRDLQDLLLSPEKLANKPAIRLPELNIPQASIAVNNSYVDRGPMWSGEEFARILPIEDPPAPAPPPAPSPTPTPISWGDAITKVQPRYPAKAKRVNASGSVDVKVTISPEGRVTEAKAISGHMLLREAAEEAALQWVFKPAMLKGAPVATQIVLTFLFKGPQ